MYDQRISRLAVSRVLLVAIVALGTTVATAAQEIGANDFLISGDLLTGTTLLSLYPAVAFNPLNDNYLVVWEERYRYLTCAPDVETAEIHRRFVSGAGVPLASFQVTVSSMGGNCDGYGAREAAVAYNSTENEYFVVWSGSDEADGGLVDEYEIFGQRIEGATGLSLGTPSLRITEVGGIGAPSPDASEPVIAYNATDNEFLLVYRNDATIETRVLDAEGATVHGPFPLGPAGLFGVYPAVTWSSLHNEYVVVWAALDGVNPGSAIVAVHLDPNATPTTPTYPVTDPGTVPSYQLGHGFPSLAYDPTNDQFLVAWQGEGSGGSSAAGGALENEILVQRLSGDGTPLGENAVISDAGVPAGAPSVAYSSVDNRFLVAWTASVALDGYDVWGQWLDSAGQQIPGEDFRLSDMGGVTGDVFNGGIPDVVWHPSRNEYLIVWYGDDDVAGGTGGGGTDNDTEVYGQRVSSAVVFSDGFESGNTTAW